ncbi:Nodulation transcriptional regulatory protein NodD2 [Bradyrhizobium sp. ORS 285]|uniref:LysR family transcriptional regulator n=1 Tax=Bradyrhizobium sp. ORS 285 TaxID=115808 RepID=UPI0002408FFA|nr:LysR family transcriptional regulator [Bradyrhizobium sp. ORS 285]CCA64471.1 Nodulation transcriptional regulatory protein NodD2 [Bradyrhizobium sp. ORS 285]CCD89790.1 Nodulation transcriptional regulatory protein NodD2 [Bradyrhizobium sp. ORS 285]SMX56540.1 Nodulation transcriptional regulatory protein NodD2 [Bradyrhizobium sp. ORS 285]
MRFKGLDLNLLVALDALLTQENLTTAARSINLSQPAMSAAIARLRIYFGDELFTMRGRQLVPTPRALALATPVRDALAHINLNIISTKGFNPPASQRRYKVITSDFMTMIFVRKVIDRIQREAPGVSLELLPPADGPDELLRRAEVDFIIYPEVFMSNAHPRLPLFDDRLVCVSCPTNENLPESLTLHRYLSLGHVAARFARSLRPQFEERLLTEHGLSIRIEISVPGFSMIPAMLRGTPRIAYMPSMLVRHYGEKPALRVIKPPIPLLSFTEAVQWPHLHNCDPGSIWMRKIFLQEASLIASNAPQA